MSRCGCSANGSTTTSSCDCVAVMADEALRRALAVLLLAATLGAAALAFMFAPQAA